MFSCISKLNSSYSVKKDSFEGHILKISCLVKLNKSTVASASNDGRVLIWNIEVGDYTTALCGHTKEVTCLLKIDDYRLVSGSWDQTFILWNYKTGALLYTHNVYSGYKVYCLLNLGNMQVIAGCKNELIIWDLSSENSIKQLDDHYIDSDENCFCSLKFKKDVLLIGKDKLIYRYYAISSNDNYNMDLPS